MRIYPLILDSIKVVDRLPRVDTPSGPAWHRYNGDGCGLRPSPISRHLQESGQFICYETGHFHLLPTRPGQRIDFTFQRADTGEWSGRDYSVTVESAEPKR